MSETGATGKLAEKLRHGLRLTWRTMRRRGPSQAQFWVIALLIGIVAGFVALMFRKGIYALQTLFYGTDDLTLFTVAGALPWYVVLIIPIFGGLLVGIILHHFTPDGRARAVADVIEGAALSRGRVEIRAGLASALASLITLSSGGSSGREGPVVHLSAVVSTWVAARLDASGVTGRDLLGCAVAAGVSASFNAPIAGTIFALEVVLRHYAIHAFAPIAIASVAGTVINRLEFGNVTEFSLPGQSALAFYWELPAFMILGLVSGLVAVVLMRSVFWAEDAGNLLQRASGLPRWLRPAVAGALLGLIAIWFPHIIGVGYEVTSLALTGQLLLHEAIVLCAVKVVAVAITLGGRMGGGMFSPALVVGALTGLAFGLIATAVFPEVSGAETLYALAGMGAVAAAVLGAPISTTLIVFELTGDWQTGIAVMVAVSLSTALASRLVRHSFFLEQLHRRGLRIASGPQTYLRRLVSIDAATRPLGTAGTPTQPVLQALADGGMSLQAGATLETALPLFDRCGQPVLPVLHPQTGALQGTLSHVDALRAYNRALVAMAAEEHS